MTTTGIPTTGDDAEFLLVGGLRLRGRVEGVGGDWVTIACEGRAVQVNLAHVAVWAVGGLPDQAAPPVRAAKGPSRKGSPGRPWPDDDLRLLANALLDGASPKDLAREFGRTPAVINQLHQAFECVRGNVIEEALGEVARTWVPRWRRVLGGER